MEMFWSFKQQEWKDISVLLKGTSTCWMDKQHVCFHNDNAGFKWVYIFDLSLPGSDLSDSYLSWKLISVWCSSENYNTCLLFLIFLSLLVGLILLLQEKDHHILKRVHLLVSVIDSVPLSVLLYLYRVCLHNEYMTSVGFTAAEALKLSSYS